MTQEEAQEFADDTGDYFCMLREDGKLVRYSGVGWVAIDPKDYTYKEAKEKLSRPLHPA